MPNFNAKLRNGFQDIGGLVLDCREDDYVLDDSGNVETWTNQAPSAPPVYSGTHTGSDSVNDLEDSSKSWITDGLIGQYVFNTNDGSWATITGNSAATVVTPLQGGGSNQWNTDDPYTLGIPRFDSPTQSIAARRPSILVVGGETYIRFHSADDEFLDVPLSNMDYPAINMSLAFDLVGPTGPGGSPPTANEVVCRFLGTKTLTVYRQESLSDYGWKTDTTTVLKTGYIDDGAHVIANDDDQDGQFWTDGEKVSTLTGDLFFSEKTAAASVGVIGCQSSGTLHLFAALQRFSAWRKDLSDNEIALINDTYGVGATGSVYANISKRDWVDGTGTVDQPSRLNPKRGIAPKFYMAEVPVTGKYIQIAGEIGGLALPDTALNGDLFTLDCIEWPQGKPGVYQQAGWSSIFDVLLHDPGHYTFCMRRAYGGSVVLHVDVERS